MEVVLAEHAGACYGVQRALDMAHAVMEEGKSASTLGPLIHNPKVVDSLAAKGMSVIDRASDAEGGCVVIRSHGVTPEERDELKAQDVEIIDATCPHVSRAQKAAADLAGAGCHVIVVGEQGHPEVEGLMAYAGQVDARVDVALTAEDLPADIEAPVGVVVQTTQTRGNLDNVLEGLAARGIEPLVKDTICSATRQRQEAAEALASHVDAMVVLGGKNSSNTTRLAEICSRVCERTYHVESPEELRSIDLSGCARVGVSAGASTPEDQIEEMVTYLKVLS